MSYYNRSQLLIILVISILGVSVTQSTNPTPCPCTNATLCEPLNIGPRKEFLGFSVSAVNWDNYDMSILTTIVKFGDDPIPEMMCEAHASGVRVTNGVDYPANQLTNETYKADWIAEQISSVQASFYDGINIDFESQIPKTDPFMAALLTALVTDVTLAFKNINQGYQISMDVPAAPFCYSNRCFNYNALGQALDLMVIMDYDMNGNGIAGANSDLPGVISGAGEYLSIDVPAEKLVMAFPWYGYNYHCNGDISLDTRDCLYDPSQRWNSSMIFDMCYNQIMTLFDSTTNGGVQWDEVTQTPFFNFVGNDTIVRQMWFDNAKSTYAKVASAKSLGVGGVGVWYLDCVDIATQSDMWQSIQSFFN
ncbi:hypothetical protein SAMD00019534_100720 [Acytostelium subglobosum LB1]|uniref:hypothetical protein n=1 Tax=Acytostelium subglobosum LB1 TaxID=1410327 RepID=UPI000644B9F4|nr:hypothetical protein SAMD00019534_100720 [Acytostelium subglobosum LB1]GAM26897.1 hypothetical protein SAMD00019534_100720 [Acytostelium subglobosum LB1]|eukprot:XP_012750165.1 hypothetical protein SAMD00019534_100720 [Acytostelium subglobosum LB1]